MELHSVNPSGECTACMYDHYLSRAHMDRETDTVELVLAVCQAG